MESLLLPAAAAVAVFIIFLVAVPKSATNETTVRKRSILERISAETESSQMKRGDETQVVLRDVLNSGGSSPLGALALKLPFGRSTYQLLLKSGFGNSIPRFLMACGVLFLVLVFLLSKLKSGPFVAIFFAFVVTFVAARKFLAGRIVRRSEKFINQFPDAIDMIVRSVRSGHPLNTSLRMISENMEPPVSTEFRQVVDEIAYGRTLTEALGRLAQRIDEPDLQFFVVVLSVQQETGGNLAEVLGNLSNIIRKRRQLRMKIKAMTSEGRATAYVLGGLPCAVFGALYFLSPGYLDPLFDTTQGNILLGSAIGLILFAGWVVKQMVNIEI